MRKFLSILLTPLILLNPCITVFAVDGETNEENICYTGSFEMDAEQLSSFLGKIPMITDVKPNQLFNKRMSEEFEINAESLSGSNFNIVADGDEIITNIDNMPSTLLTNEISYPSKADNSTEETFPVIKSQGDLNSCLGWSLAYYQLTNNANKVRGTTARNGSSNISTRVYSPNWVYNLGNLGSNSGMYGNSATNVLYTYGCPTLSQIPLQTSSSTATNYLTWYPTASIQENALYNKCDLYYGTVNPDELDTPITSPDSNYLYNIKKILADGYVVTVETFVNPNGSPYLPITKVGKTSTNSSAYVWTEVRKVSGGGHAVTIVGYDDNFKVDINGDGSYQAGEYGAFKIANSWGTGVSKHNNGYVWLAYDALNTVSSVSSSNNSARTPALRNGDLYYFIKPQNEYKPLLTASVGFNTKYRDELNIKLGIADADNSTNYYEKNITRANYITDGNDENYLDSAIAFGYGNGSYNLSGTSGKSTGYVTFDFTSLLQEFELKNNHNYKLYMKLYDYSDTGTTINSFALKDHNTGSTFVSDEIPLSTYSDNNPIKITVAYLSSIMSATNNKTFTLTFNSNLDENTVNDMNINVANGNNDDTLIDLSLGNNKNEILLSPQNRFFNNNFYTLHVYTDLKSQGGNNLDEVYSCPFYVPFH